jgi:hypothetical protein
VVHVGDDAEVADQAGVGHVVASRSVSQVVGAGASPKGGRRPRGANRIDEMRGPVSTQSVHNDCNTRPRRPRRLALTETTTLPVTLTTGLDLDDRTTHRRMLHADRQVVERGRMATMREASAGDCAARGTTNGARAGSARRDNGRVRWRSITVAVRLRERAKYTR